jgi:hypothetical protein
MYGRAPCCSTRIAASATECTSAYGTAPSDHTSAVSTPNEMLALHVLEQPAEPAIGQLGYTRPVEEDDACSNVAVHNPKRVQEGERGRHFTKYLCLLPRPTSSSRGLKEEGSYSTRRACLRQGRRRHASRSYLCCRCYYAELINDHKSSAPAYSPQLFFESHQTPFPNHPTSTYFLALAASCRTSPARSSTHRAAGRRL